MPEKIFRQGFEATIDSARAFLYAASVMLLSPSRKKRMSFETDT
jgi:hypothetical protein